jgi:hypothetical protein
MNRLALSIALVLPVSMAAAGEVEDRLLDYAKREVASWTADPMIIAAVLQSNRANAAVSPNDILVLDAQWQAEVGKESALIKGVHENAVSSYLRERVAAADGTVTEVIIMDAQGLNVAISDVTSDYWQGDEAKYQETFAKGPTATHLSEIELDESTQVYQAQVSYTLTDPATGLAIGAVTVGLNAEAF